MTEHSSGFIARDDAAPPPPPAPTEERTGPVTISRELYDFLMGIGGIDGLHFGEHQPDQIGAFWWRRYLRDAEAAPAIGDFRSFNLLAMLRNALTHQDYAEAAQGNCPICAGQAADARCRSCTANFATSLQLRKAALDSIYAGDHSCAAVLHGPATN